MMFFDTWEFHFRYFIRHLGLLFSVLITGVITDAIKDTVGRPWPNFFWRCFPDGIAVGLPHPFVSLGFSKLKAWLRVTHFSKFVGDILNVQVFPPVTQDVICSGDEAVMKEGYKSFPKGHTSCKSNSKFKITLLQKSTSRTLLIHDGMCF